MEKLSKWIFHAKSLEASMARVLLSDITDCLEFLAHNHIHFKPSNFLILYFLFSLPKANDCFFFFIYKMHFYCIWAPQKNPKNKTKKETNLTLRVRHLKLSVYHTKQHIHVVHCLEFLVGRLSYLKFSYLWERRFCLLYSGQKCNFRHCNLFVKLNIFSSGNFISKFLFEFLFLSIFKIYFIVESHKIQTSGRFYYSKKKLWLWCLGQKDFNWDYHIIVINSHTYSDYIPTISYDFFLSTSFYISLYKLMIVKLSKCN